MGINDNDDNELLDAGRKEEERIRNDLMRVVLGDRELTGNGRVNRGRAVFVKNEILEKKKKKDESEQREAFKRAQEAFDRALKELEEQLEAIKKQIAEAKKDILDVEEQLRKKYGDNWEEKFRRGEADKNDRLYKEWAQKHERLDELEKKREELETRVETLKHEWSKAKTPEEKQAVIVDAKADVVWATRAMEYTKGSHASGITLDESASPLQKKLIEGKDIDGGEIAHEEKKANNDFVGGFSSFASSLDKTEAPDQDRLSSRMAFNNATGEKAVVKEISAAVSTESPKAETVHKYKGTEFSA